MTVPTNIEYHFAAEVVEKDNVHKQLKMLSEPYFRTCINKLKVGDKVSVVVTTKKPRRTDQQRKYYFHYLGIISEETGNDVEDLHNLFKGKFLSTGITEIFGEKVRKTRSTTELTINEFSDYIKQIELLTGILAPQTEGYWDE